MDHDPPAKEKQVPFGILMVVAGALTLLFGRGRPATLRPMPCRCGGSMFGHSTNTSNAWSSIWTTVQRTRVGGPSFSSGWCSLPTGRGWSTLGVLSALPQQVQSDRTLLVALEKKWNGVIPNCLKVILQAHRYLEGSPPNRETPPTRVSHASPAKEIKSSSLTSNSQTHHIKPTPPKPLRDPVGGLHQCQTEAEHALFREESVRRTAACQQGDQSGGRD